MQSQRDKIRRKNNMQMSWPRITEKIHDEAEEGGTMFANGSPFCPVISFEKYLYTSTRRTSFFFSDRRKMLAIMTMFGTGDDITCRRTFSWRENEKHLKRMKPVNYLDQSLYNGIQTRHIMAFRGHRRKNNMQMSWPRITEKIHDEAEEGGTMFANGSPFCPVISFEKYLYTSTRRTSFFFSDRRKMLAIMTMFGTGDDITCRRTFSWRENEKHLKRMKPVNYLDQSLYNGIQTRHIMAFRGHRSWNSIRSYSRLADLNVKCSKLWCLSLAAVLPRTIYTVIR